MMCPDRIERFLVTDEESRAEAVFRLLEKDLSEPLEVVFGARMAVRSERQNAFLRVLYGVVAEATGHTPAELHRLAKAHVLGDPEACTHDLPPDWFSDYIECVYAAFSESLPDVTLPDPRIVA
jgi:hypothetical protein